MCQEKRQFFSIWRIQEGQGHPFKVHLARGKFSPIERNGVSPGCSVLDYFYPNSNLD